MSVQWKYWQIFQLNFQSKKTLILMTIFLFNNEKRLAHDYKYHYTLRVLSNNFSKNEGTILLCLGVTEDSVQIYLKNTHSH